MSAVPKKRLQLLEPELLGEQAPWGREGALHLREQSLWEQDLPIAAGESRGVRRSYGQCDGSQKITRIGPQGVLKAESSRKEFQVERDSLQPFPCCFF